MPRKPHNNHFLISDIMSVTTIEWTQRPGTIGETWNPTTGCNKVDRGCKHCYAETMHKRLRAMGQAKYAAPFLDGAVGHEDTLDIPMKWTKPRTVFVNSMSDLFHKDLPFSFILQVFQTMQLTPYHTYLVLTKRPEIALEFWKWMKDQMPKGGQGWTPPRNLWMGTSANDQESANIRVPKLLDLKGVLRFLSYEPATGPLDLRKIEPAIWRPTFDALAGIETFGDYINRDAPRLHWIICGGESGPKAVPMHPAWARKVRDDCKATGVPFFFKQFGAWAPTTFLDGQGVPTVRFTHEKNIFTFTDPGQNMIKVGKHRSGHQLDGETIQQFPE
jgi:protein gp37